MGAWFRERYLDVLGSIYIYNEHRGYTAIDDLLAAVQARWPDDHELIAKIEKHRADERKHYQMFRRWFERRGIMPYSVDRAFGHIDRFVSIMFGKPIDDLDKLAVVNSDRQFGRLCRVISLTERRGYKQVEILLKNSHVLSDTTLTKIFRIIEQDEPSHWAPYDRWLDQYGGRHDRWWERMVDSYIHSELLFLKLPMLFLLPLERRKRFADEEDGRREPAAVTAAAAH
jgi:rubrerythrin